MSVVRDSWRGAKIAILRGRMTLLTTIQWAVVDAIAMSAQLLHLRVGESASSKFNRNVPTSKLQSGRKYRVTHQVVPLVLLTSKQKLRFSIRTIY